MDEERAPEAMVSDQGRLYRADRDQHITEYHAHFAPALADLSTRQRPSGPDSVRVPLTARMHSPIRDRRALRHQLLQAATGQDAAAPRIHVIHGMVSCGKTSVAQTVFDEAVSDHGVLGLWVSASSTTSFRAGMLAVAQDRGAYQDEVDAARAGQPATG